MNVWSPARARVFGLCPRQYLFRYVLAPAGRQAQPSSREGTLYILNKVLTRTGWAAHHARGAVIEILQKLRAGQAWDIEPILHQTLERMRNDYRESGEGTSWENGGATCSLFEHEYEIEVSDVLWKQTVEDTLSVVRTFAAAPVVEELKTFAPSSWLHTGEVLSMDWKDLRLMIKPEVVVQLHGKIELMALRLHKDDPAMNVTEWAAWHTVAGYLSPQQAADIRFCDVVTGEDRLVPFEGSAMDLVQQEAVAMADLTEEACPLAADEKTCFTCPFLRLCPKYSKD